MAASSYIFFEADLCDRFVQVLARHGLGCTQRADAIEGLVVELDAEPGDTLLEALEAEYEALMDEQMLRAGDHADWGTHQVASLRVTLPGGNTAEVRLPPDVARTLLERYSIDEAHALVSAIAQSLADPQDGPLCRRELLRPAGG